MELRDQHIIILGLMRFDDNIASTNYTIAKHLAKHNFVYYIDNPFTVKDCITSRRTEAFKNRYSNYPLRSYRVIDTEQPHLKVIITPPTMSINWLPEGKLYRRLLSFNEAIISRTIKQVVNKFKISNYIFINSF